MFSGCGNTESPENGCGHPKVGVVNKISRSLRACYFCIVRCPGLSSHKLGNYGLLTMICWCYPLTAWEKFMWSPIIMVCRGGRLTVALLAGQFIPASTKKTSRILRHITILCMRIMLCTMVVNSDPISYQTLYLYTRSDNYLRAH